MRIVRNSRFTDGIIGPSTIMSGPVSDGGRVVFTTSPACWGPMITPSLKSGHEVNVPVAVEGAHVGDAVACKIRRIRILSMASSSGVHESVEGTYECDPTVKKKCPRCGTLWPEVVVRGIGLEAIMCAKCGASVSPFRMRTGYTMVFDDRRRVGVTVNRRWAEKIARERTEWGAIPKDSVQVSVLLAAKTDHVGIATRLRAFMGQLGTTPSKDIPASKNAGDLGSSLIGATHEWSLTDEELAAHRTDAHMDCDSVRAGGVVICPIKIDRGGVYAGDAHAMQGDGEVAGHTTDIASECTVDLEIIKGLALEGPIILPPKDDLSYLAKPLKKEESKLLQKLAREYGVSIEESGPVQFVGSGANLNKATDNGLERAARLLGVSKDEIGNRATIAGSIEIARLPGVITVTLLAPRKSLEKMGIAQLVRDQYRLPW